MMRAKLAYMGVRHALNIANAYSKIAWRACPNVGISKSSGRAVLDLLATIFKNGQGRLRPGVAAGGDNPATRGGHMGLVWGGHMRLATELRGEGACASDFLGNLIPTTRAAP